MQAGQRGLTHNGSLVPLRVMDDVLPALSCQASALHVDSSEYPALYMHLHPTRGTLSARTDIVMDRRNRG